MLLHAVTLGCAIDLRAPRVGRVHSVFARAINLAVDGDLWTVFACDHPDSPFGLRLAAGDLAPLQELRAGDPVHIRAGHLGLGPHVIDGRCAARWAPRRWRPPASGLDQRLAAVELGSSRRAWPGSADLARDLTRALQCHGPQACQPLSEAVRCSLGCGPGLTPAGDDVLVGLLAVLGNGIAGATGARTVARLTDALAPWLHTTTELSRHLIAQAARGLPGRALHDLGQALVEGAAPDALDHALATVMATGATSGADACVGLAAGCRLLFPAAERLAA